jgi:TatD DNase family protein
MLPNGANNMGKENKDSVSEMKLIDSHAHLDMIDFAEDRGDTIQRARSAGITHIIDAGIDIASSSAAIELTRCYNFISAAVGIHPQESKETKITDIEQVAILAQHPGVVAIGEIGLDFYRDYAPQPQQIEIFEHQLLLAYDLNLPVVIHCRQADATLMSLLKNWTRQHPRKKQGVIHCFSGNLETAQNYINLGFYISLGAYIGYPSSKILREVIGQLPIERLLLETDCPYLPPQHHRGKRNEPAYLIDTARILSEIKGLSLEDVAKYTAYNTFALFEKIKS